MARTKFNYSPLQYEVPPASRDLARAIDLRFRRLEEVLANFESADTTEVDGVPAEEIGGQRLKSQWIEVFDDDVEDNWTVRQGDSTFASLLYVSTGITGGRAFSFAGRMRLEYPFNIPYDPRRVYRLRTRVRMSAAPTDGQDASLAQDSSGLLEFDDFDREDSTTVGNDWTENTSGWNITSNRLQISANSEQFLSKANVARGEVFLQALLNVESTAGTKQLGIVGRLDYNGGSYNGYTAYHNVGGDFFLAEYNGGSGVIIDQDTGASASTDIGVQLYVADGVQQAAYNIGNTHTKLSASDTTHDGVEDATFGFQTNATHGSTRQADDFLAFASKDITVNGLPSGYKAEVRDSGGSVVVDVTGAGGGTDTMDASVFGGDVPDELVPTAGWAELVIVDDEGADVITYDDTGIYPGDEYTFTPAVAGNDGFFRWGLQGIGQDEGTVVSPSGGTNALSGHTVGADRAIEPDEEGDWIELEAYVTGQGDPGSNSPGIADNPSRMHTDARYIRPWFEIAYEGGDEVIDVDFLAFDILTVEDEIDALLTRNAPAEEGAEQFTGNDFSLLSARFFSNLLRSLTDNTGLNVVVSQIDNVGDLTETTLIDDGVAKRAIAKGLTPGSSSDGDAHTFATAFQDIPLMVPYPGGLIDGPDIPDTITVGAIGLQAGELQSDTSGDSGDAFTGQLDLPLPSDVVDDDVLYMYVMASEDGGTPSSWNVPSGWTSLASRRNAFKSVGLFRRVVTTASGEDDPVSVTINENALDVELRGFIFRARNVDTTTPEDAATTVTTPANDSTPDGPSITTATDNAVVVSFMAMNDDDDGITIVKPAGFTTLLINEEEDNNIGVASLRQASSGASGAINWPNTDGDETEDSIMFTLAIRPDEQPTEEAPEIIPKVQFDGLSASGFDEFVAKLLARVVTVNEITRSFAAGTITSEGGTKALDSVLDDDADDDEYRAIFDVELNIDSADDLIAEDDSFPSGVMDAVDEDKSISITEEASDDEYTVTYDWDVEVTANGEDSNETENLSGTLDAVGETSEATLGATAKSPGTYTAQFDVDTVDPNFVVVQFQSKPFGGSWTTRDSVTVTSTGLDTLTFNDTGIGEGDSVRLRIDSASGAFSIAPQSVTYTSQTFDATAGITLKVESSTDGGSTFPNTEDTASFSVNDTDGTGEADSGTETVVFTRNGVTDIRVRVSAIDDDGDASSRTTEADPDNITYATGEAETATIKVTVALDAKDGAGAWVEKDSRQYSLTDSTGNGEQDTFTGEELSFVDSAIDNGDDIRLRVKSEDVTGEADSSSFVVTPTEVAFNELTGETQEFSKTPLTSDKIVWYALAG